MDKQSVGGDTSKGRETWDESVREPRSRGNAQSEVKNVECKGEEKKRAKKRRMGMRRPQGRAGGGAARRRHAEGPGKPVAVSVQS